MAVYEHTYKRYTGPQTAEAWRFLVLPRFIFKDVFKSRLLVFFYALSFIYPIFLAAVIYLRNNLDMLELVISQSSEFFDQMQIGSEVFLSFLYTQGFFSFLLTLFIGPGLISRDLANNGLPLYLSRPISRAQYVTGKIAVLFILLSGITWGPGVALWTLQGSLAGDGWMFDNVRIFIALVLGSWAWILLLALFALALSAWVKWKLLAGFGMLVIFIFATPFGFIISEFFRTNLGHLVNPGFMMATVWTWLIGQPHSSDAPPVFAACLSLIAMAGALLFLLHVKLRAYEVVK